MVEERALLEPLRARADITLETGDLNVNQLRARIFEMFGETDAGEHMQISIPLGSSMGSHSTSTCCSIAGSWPIPTGRRCCGP